MRPSRHPWSERAYFALCLASGRLLRSARYSKAEIADDRRHVRKRRASYAPLLVWMGGPLFRLLDTGLRILPQRAWEERERELYRTLYEASIRVDADGTLVLPCLAGETLAALLEDADLEGPVRKRIVGLAVTALADLHRRGLTHGDAMADNVAIDLAAGAARWFDFEALHDSRRSMTWRRADDVRALLATCVLRTPPGHITEIAELILDAYADDHVTSLLAERFASAFRRPLLFHLAQAALSYGRFQQIARVLRDRRDGWPRASCRDCST